MASSCYQGSLPCVTKLLRSLQPSTKSKPGSRSVSTYKARTVLESDFNSLGNSKNCVHIDLDLLDLGTSRSRHYSAFSGAQSVASPHSRLSVYGSKWAGDLHVLRIPFILSGTTIQQYREINGRSNKNSPTRYYDILGISPKATQHQIKSAYYNMSKLHHPDVAKGSKSHALFTEISEAYEVLGNLRKRRMYDRGIYTRDNSLNSAEEDMDEDYTAAYRQAKRSPFERGDRPPPPRGRTNVYNFDEFYRQHYNEIRERRANEYKEFRQHQDTMRGSGRGGEHSHSSPSQSLFLAVSLLVILGTLAISLENYDRDLIGSTRIGSSHPNYYGACDPLRKIPVSPSQDKDSGDP